MGIFTQLRDGDDEPEDGTGAAARAATESEAAHDAATAEDDGDEEDDDRKGTFGRRAFLGGTAATLAGVGADRYFGRRHVPRANALVRMLQEQRPKAKPHDDPISFTPPVDGSYDYFIQVERDEDLLLLDFYFYNFTTRENDVNQLYLTPTDATNYIVVRMPPQAICEAVYWQDDGVVPAAGLPANPHETDPTGLPMDPTPVLSALSGQSQLCFTMDESDAIEITGSVTDLLDWSGWTLNVPTTAQQPQSGSGAGVSSLPNAFETFIEFPYCLFLAPSVWVGAATLDLNNFEIPIGFSTTFCNRASPLGDVINPITQATVNEIFTTTLMQTPASLAELFYEPGLAAFFCTDASLPQIGPFDATPETNILYEGQGAT